MLVETRKKRREQPMGTRQTKKSLFYLVGKFCVKKHTEHALLQTILKSKFNLVSRIQAFRLSYQKIPFIVSSGNLSNQENDL